MIIKPISIEVNNFLSYKYQKLDIANGLHFISGKNGAGKTSFFVESCVYCLYNKSMSGKKLSELVHKDYNKNMFVNIMIQIDNDFHILVERGESPKRFNVYVENVDGDKTFNNINFKKTDNLAENKDMQEWLEENFLKMNHKEFITYILKSKATDFSFLRMDKADRDKYLENLFDLNIYRKMSDNVKIKIKDQETIMSIAKKEYDESLIKQQYETERVEELKQIKLDQKVNDIMTLENSKNKLFDNDPDLVRLKLNIQSNDQKIKDIIFDLDKKNTIILNKTKEYEDHQLEIKTNISNINNEYDIKKEDIKKNIIEQQTKLSNVDKEYDAKSVDIITRGKTTKATLLDRKDKLVAVEKLLLDIEETQNTDINDNNMFVKKNNDVINRLSVEIKDIDIWEKQNTDIELMILNCNIERDNIINKIKTTSKILDDFKIVDRLALFSEIESLISLDQRKYNNLINFLINFKSTLSSIDNNLLSLEQDLNVIDIQLHHALMEQPLTKKTLNEMYLINDVINDHYDNLKILETKYQHFNRNYIENKNKQTLIKNNLQNEISNLEKTINDYKTEYKNLDTNKELEKKNIETVIAGLEKSLISLEENYNTKLDNEKNKVITLTNNIKSFNDEHNKFIENSNNTIILLNQQISLEEDNLLNKKYDLNRKIREIDKTISGKLFEELDVDNNRLLECDKNSKYYYEKYNIEYDLLSQYNVIKDMLTGKSNIKIYLMEKFRKYLNKQINHYSGKFKLPCVPMFDENYNVVLVGGGYEQLSIKSLSEGEMVKASLSILFSSVDVKKIIYNHSDFQMLMFDEVLANIDIESITDILEVLSEYGDKMFCGIINHGHNDYSVDGYYLNIEKNNGCSSIVTK